MLTPYFEGLTRCELLVTRCTACGTAQFPPRRACPHCAVVGTARWVTTAGRGTVWSFCVFHQAYLPPPAPRPPYTVAVVALDEGSKLISNIGGVDDLYVGMRVRAVYSTEGGEPRVRFAPEATS